MTFYYNSKIMVEFETPIPRLPHHIAGNYDQFIESDIPTVTLIVEPGDRLEETTENPIYENVGTEVDNLFLANPDQPILVLNTSEYEEDPDCFTCDVRRSGNCLPEQIKCLDEEAMGKLHISPGEIITLQQLLSRTQ